MSFALEIYFPTGRYHATAWGRHVNEAVPDWPPAPWRLLRAFVAVWKRLLSRDPDVSAHLPSIIAQLVEPPLFKLPSALLSHTRHYMPLNTKLPPKADTSNIFDGFVVVGSDTPLGVFWPNANLSDVQSRVLRNVVERLRYLGRAESWCIAQVVDVERWEKLDGRLCAPDHSKEALLVDSPQEPVRLLCANPETWNQWSYRSASRPQPAWNLLVETRDIQREGWSDPPGSRWVTYMRPLDALKPPPVRRSFTVVEQPKRPTLLKFALDGVVLPRVTETLYVGELVRRHVQGIYGKLFNGQSSLRFSGKQADGQPAQGHQHAFFLPIDEDSDGRLDHVLIFSPSGFTSRELKTLDVWRTLHAPAGTKLNVVWVSMEEPLPQAKRWRSVTPFVATRHYKTRGRKRDCFPRHQLVEVNLLEELQRRGLRPVSVQWIDGYFAQGHVIPWRHFRQRRVFGKGRRGVEPGQGFEIEFDQPVVGPLAVGYGAHFGLGLFVPADQPLLPYVFP